MKEFFLQSKQTIKPFLDTFFRQQIKKYRTVNSWAKDSLVRLCDCVSGGKMVRGGLVYVSYTLAGKRPDATCLKLAAAMELVHTALVVHDDVMDGDTVRRGKPTVHNQYEQLARNEFCKNAGHVGESMAMCTGDVAIFLSFNLLASVPAALSGQLVHFFSEELTRVGFAQMHDVYAGVARAVPRQSEILNLYRYKTARYTFSLPLLLGGTAAGLSKKTVAALEQFGEHLGIIFQIKDDELGMFGDEKMLGKPIGSDIREGKKTLYYYYIYKNASTSEIQILNGIFGNQNVTKKQLEFVRQIITKYHIDTKINKLLAVEIAHAQKLVAAIAREQSQKKLLNGLLEYNLNRST